jgi:hypothetical protein
LGRSRASPCPLCFSATRGGRHNRLQLSHSSTSAHELSFHLDADFTGSCCLCPERCSRECKSCHRKRLTGKPTARSSNAGRKGESLLQATCRSHGQPAISTPSALGATEFLCSHQTLSIEHASDDMASSRLADEALAGFAKGALYDQHRPSYPLEAVEKLLSALRVSGAPAAVILDLAAGTGKFTESLAQREENFNVIAVEPHSHMRQELERKALSNVTVKSGLASSIPLQDKSVDAVIAAQVRSFRHTVAWPSAIFVPVSLLVLLLRNPFFSRFLLLLFSFSSPCLGTTDQPGGTHKKTEHPDLYYCISHSSRMAARAWLYTSLRRADFRT